MLNDALKLNIAPWQEKGRWYHAFVESNGSAASLTFSDLDSVTASGTSLTMPADFHVISYEFADLDLAASKTLAKNVCKTSAAGKEFIVLPSAADYTYADIWFFGYQK